ncbi:RagB/SusD family nutrient uptake outer membrane protein [Niabella yanshanensis]|uniref:RagB/SusD family nutrient uptake outer membrane protein n=1 Tax=Niabella yanshanensis TaxID=577386 RepID=A0ABZ0W475_9BACT|nr:RagB/SusD family nutrient uptake outer membrane protein [Niabella yanshanensis]WQD38001.1 RagB/SusD family nutrient uptake outer membrane protein [Niabella yanshanensis]
MKKNIIILTLLSIGLFCGCKKGLDRTTYGVLSPVNFPKTEADFEIYTMVVYKPFGSRWSYGDGGNQFLWHGAEWSNTFINDLPSDLFAIFPEWGGYWRDMSEANFVPRINHGADGHFHKTRFITRITKIIADLEAATVLSDAKRTQLLAEARMARGWLMYYLHTLYGPVPVILDPAKVGTDAEADLTRPDKDVFVQAAAADLRFAADNLVKAPAEYGRFNKGIALGVLMRLYLFDKNFAGAEAAGREILAMGYSLNGSYRDLFRTATERNNETIWAVSVDPAGDGTGARPNFNAWGFYTYPSNYPGMLPPTGARRGGYANPAAFAPTWAFYDSFDPLDKRRELLITSYGAIASNGTPTGVTITRSGMRGPVCAKYPDDDATPFQGNDIPVLRYADVLLMLAEAINGNTGPSVEAANFVNQVRSRAGVDALLPAQTASKEAFSTAILQERAWELYFEGFRRVDLMRFGKWNEYLIAAGKNPLPLEGNGYFPIPQYILNAGAGKVIQNPGYPQ